MKKLSLIIALLFAFTYSFGQEKQYEVKKILSPQYGKIPAGKTKITISDEKIIYNAGKKPFEFIVEQIEETDFTKTYFSKMGTQNDIRFTYYKNDNYLKYENKDNFTGKVEELLYYFK